MKPFHVTMRSIPWGIVILAFLSQLVPSLVVAASVEELYRQGCKEYQVLSKTPKKRWNREAWDRCIRTFEQVAGQDIDDRFAAKAYYYISRSYEALYKAYKKPQDFEAAVQYYRKIVYECPDSVLADDAQYAMGELFMNKDVALAYPEFVKVGILFPNGDMAPRAARRVAQLEKKLDLKSSRQKADQLEKLKAESLPAPPNPAAQAQQSPQVQGKPASVRPAVAQVDGVQHWAAEDYSRIAIYVSRSVKFEQHTLPPDPASKRPARIYLDLKDCVVGPEIRPKLPIMDGFLQGVRLGQFKSTQTRVVLDIQSIETFKVFSLRDPFRVVIDVRGKRNQSPPSEKGEKKDAAQAEESKPKKSKAEKLSTPKGEQQRGDGIKRIVLDPGHGGKDPGAVGSNGVYEKDVVLGVAKSLKTILKSQLGYEVFLTRTKDEFLSLEERTAIANMKKADLFISLHVNAHKDKSINGIETYYLNVANDAEAARVAALENAVSAKELSDLEAILHDLMFNTKIEESSRLAKSVQGGMIDELVKGYPDVRDLGVKHAPFYVLIGAEMPCVLIETAFISNEQEELRLKDGGFQENLARGIAVGLQSYAQRSAQVAQAE